jgi:hypothetical protein
MQKIFLAALWLKLGYLTEYLMVFMGTGDKAN